MTPAVPISWNGRARTGECVLFQGNLCSASKASVDQAMVGQMDQAHHDSKGYFSLIKNQLIINVHLI